MVAGLSSSSGYQSAHWRLGVWTGTLSAWNVPGHSYEVLWFSILPADSTWQSSMASLNRRGDFMSTVYFCFWKSSLSHLWCRLFVEPCSFCSFSENELVCSRWQSPCWSLQLRRRLVLELKEPLISSFGLCGFPANQSNAGQISVLQKSRMQHKNTINSCETNGKQRRIWLSIFAKNCELSAHKWYRWVLHLVSQKDPSNKPLRPYRKLHWLQLQQSANHMLQSESKNSCRDWLQSKPYKKGFLLFFFFSPKRSPSIKRRPLN